MSKHITLTSTTLIGGGSEGSAGSREYLIDPTIPDGDNPIANPFDEASNHESLGSATPASDFVFNFPVGIFVSVAGNVKVDGPTIGTGVTIAANIGILPGRFTKVYDVGTTAQGLIIYHNNLSTAIAS